MNYKQGVSIIICCYNSSKLLNQTLKYISLQVLTEGMAIEVILVDNASTDNTSKVATKIWQELNSNIPFKVVYEYTPGLTYARDAGCKEANYSYIIFCDDDNWLDSDYSQVAFEIMNSNPDVGIVGGEIEASFEVNPPEWFKQLDWTYAVGKQAQTSGNITKDGRICGAGMVIRKSIWEMLKKRNFQPLLSDRKGSLLSTGGDTEFCWNVRLLGYQIYYDTRLKLIHFMTADRLNWKYCRKLQRGIGESMAYLSIYGYIWNRKYNHLKISPTKYWHRLIWKDVQQLLSSYKRLYFFFIKDLEGEFYICTYEHSLGRLIQLIKIRSYYNLLVEQIEQDFKA